VLQQNALQLEAARATPALSRFNCDAMPISLTSPNLSIAVLYRFCCWYITSRRDFDLWHLTLNICSISSVTWWNSVSDLNAIDQSAASYCDFSVWSYDLEHVLSVALGSVIICTKVWSLTAYSYQVIAFYADKLCQAVTLTFDSLTLEVRSTSSVTWSKSVQNLSEIEQSQLILDNFAIFCTR